MVFTPPDDWLKGQTSAGQHRLSKEMMLAAAAAEKCAESLGLLADTTHITVTRVRTYRHPLRAAYRALLRVWRL
jgi:hypothetical protein